jgi:hypothetical protein
MIVATRLSSPKSRQFIAWYPCEKGNRPVGCCRTFVPEGLNDRSQAIHCLVSVQSRIRPVGHGLILTHD